jgi:excinuclease Cho
VGLVERDGDWVQTQVVDRWRHVGTLEQGVPIEEAARRDHLARGPIDPGFDVDSYRILVKPVLTGQVVRLDWPGAAAG